MPFDRNTFIRCYKMALPWNGGIKCHRNLLRYFTFEKVRTAENYHSIFLTLVHGVNIYCGILTQVKGYHGLFTSVFL
jgi:hypothetical protein